VCGPGLLGLDGEQVEFAGERFQDADHVQAILFQLAVLLAEGSGRKASGSP
jgi:hypothetical protein